MTSTKRSLRHGFAALLVACASATAHAADPQTPQTPQTPKPADARAECVEHHVAVQKFRREGKLIEARQMLISCSRSCPNVIQNDCIRWLDEVEGQIPSVIVRARVGDKDVPDTHLVIDGKEISTSLDGREVPLDPGPHHFLLEHGKESTERDVLVASGEQGRWLLFDFEPPPTAAAPVAAPAEQPVLSRPIPASVFVAGGVTAIALGAAIVFALAGKHEENDLLATCAPSCTRDQFDALQSKYHFANAAFGVSAVGAVATAVLFLVRPTVSESPKPDARNAARLTGWSVGWSPTTGSSVGVEGRF